MTNNFTSRCTSSLFETQTPGARLAQARAGRVRRHGRRSWKRRRCLSGHRCPQGSSQVSAAGPIRGPGRPAHPPAGHGEGDRQAHDPSGGRHRQLFIQLGLGADPSWLPRPASWLMTAPGWAGATLPPRRRMRSRAQPDLHAALQKGRHPRPLCGCRAFLRRAGGTGIHGPVPSRSGRDGAGGRFSPGPVGAYPSFKRRAHSGAGLTGSPGSWCGWASSVCST